METNARIHQDRMPIPQTCRGRMNFYEKLGIGISGIAAMATHVAWNSLGMSYLNQVEGIDDPKKETWMGSLLPLGAIIGSLPVGVLADKYGRKFLSVFASLLMLISWFIICFMPTKTAIYGARFSAGLGCGMASIVVPMYFFEMLNSDKQRHIVHFVHWVFNLGTIWAYVAYLKYSPKPQIDGKVFEGPRILATGMTSLIASFMIFLPESPMWLENRGEKESAERAIKKITGLSVTLDTSEPVKVIGNSGLRLSIFRTINNKKDLALILSFITLQQLIGIGPIMFNLKDMLDDIISVDIPYWVYYVVLLVPTLISFTLIKVFRCIGEKFLLLISSSAMTICAFLLSGFAYLAKSEEHNIGLFVPIVPLLLISVYITAFHIGLGPIPWVMIGKMFPINNRKMVYNLAVTYSWILLFITTKTYVDTMIAIGLEGIFLIYVFVGLFTIFFSIFLVPRRVEQIQEEILENLDEINRSCNP